jgi:hypothetical protein
MKLILPVLTCCFFVSCASYQVLTVSSRETRQNEANEFVIENDTLELCYNFNGRNGPIKMKIRNKLQQPMYIDWKRSTLIINDRAISYVPGTMAIEGSVSGTSYSWSGDYSRTHGRMNAAAKLPTDVEFIPPQTYVTKTLMGITNQSLNKLPDSLFSKKRIPAMGKGYEWVQQACFTEESSPLVFRSYLTLMIGDSLPRLVSYQQNFYISELVKTNILPEILNRDARGDHFFVVKTPDTDSVSMGYGVVGGKAVLKSKL